ncbi:NCS2 family permease [Leucobacter soli]|uniref:Guanine/hypoxanthine permease PbuG n=1 Tax=Leucobacter soli TaxID=2812850 RepID=A0A916JUI0_9MICO|nr:NCS2 family permease [Leucobacter soli]CAG7599423.1 Guanine/hypoxanthine permease PbuG [Leucobacter soli]
MAETESSTTAKSAQRGQGEPSGALDRYFEISKRGSTFGREVRGGIVTFVTMAYIVILNPIILTTTTDVAGTRLEFGQVGAVTALTAGVMTILFGIVSRLPFAFAAGLGINAFLAFTVVGQVTWPEAMALVMINGALIVLLAATGLRRMIFDAVPMELKIAITVGIGLFIAFIGFVNAGFVTSSASPPVGLGVFGSVATVPTLLFIVTLVITGILVARKVRGGLLIGLVTGTVLAVVVEAIWHLGARGTDEAGNVVNPGGWGLTVPELTGNPFQVPDLSLVGAVSFDFGKVAVIAVVMLVFSLLFMNFFDAMGTFTGLSREAELADEKGNFPRLKSALVVEGVGALAGGFTSSSSNTVFIESGSGIGEGARTGFANLVTGVLFLLAMFLTPIAEIVPTEVAAAALVVVGAMMMTQIKSIDLARFDVALPVFLTVTVMPFTYSIANGIGAGFISWVLIRTFSGKGRDVHWLLWTVAAGFVIYFARGPIEMLLGA